MSNDLLKAFDFLTVTCSLPSSPSIEDTVEVAVSGDFSIMSILVPLYSKRKRKRVYQMIHCKRTIWTIRLPE